jgi:hypothetical protein
MTWEIRGERVWNVFSLALAQAVCQDRTTPLNLEHLPITTATFRQKMQQAKSNSKALNINQSQQPQ